MLNLKNAVGAAVGVVAIAAASHAAVRLVPQDYPTIQAAIDAAQNGDIVLVADGVYAGAGNRDIDLLGKAITLQSLNGHDATVIDVQATPQQWHMGFDVHMQETLATVIQGFTIKNGYSFNGAGMNIVNSSPTIRNCVFMDNYAACWGGAMFYSGGISPVISDCVFTANESAAEGGAIFGLDGAPTFTNCQFTDNAAGAGGAIFSWGNAPGPKLVNSTVVGNSANSGSAVYSNNLKASNSIIWGNTGAAQQIYTPHGTTLSVKFSIVQGGFPGQGNLNVEPQFIDAAGGDFHLVQGSSGIDAGDPQIKDTPGVIDVDGDPRVFGAAIDMGLDEFRKPGDVDGDHAVNVNDMLQLVAAWGPCTWSTADLSGDFAVNITDLLIVIDNWE